MVLQASDVSTAVAARGLDFFTGVPCSFLTPLIDRVIDDPALTHVAATSEGEAVAIAAGAWLAGRQTAVMIQNSGLGNAINPLTSLNWPFRIPTLLIVTWRGQPGLADEPQHQLMGRITAQLLDAIEVEARPFPDTPEALAETLDTALAAMARSGRSQALIMAKGTIQGTGLKTRDLPVPAPGVQVDLTEGGPRPRRRDLLERVLAAVPDAAAIVASTGYCGRELFTLADREQHFYLVGSMGGASALGLGIACNRPVPGPVVVLDGDGAALMKLGNLATIGAYGPPGLVHVILDNGVHESTGGQATVAAGVDFAAIAKACGYRHASTTDGIRGFEQALPAALEATGPALIHARIAPGTEKPLARPTVSPAAVAERFRDFLCAASAAGEG